ncbi:MAG TPA: hypothetical protein VIK86_02675 [Candidatus Paceibacterota bacterium]
MITKNQYGFEQIKIPDKLDEVIKKAIERAKKEKKRRIIKLNSTKLIESNILVLKSK